jgi:hypothetical protein
VLAIGNGVGLGVSLGRGEEECVGRCDVAGDEGRGGLGVELAGGLAPGGVPAVGVAIGDAGDGGEHLADVHDILVA